MHFQHVHKTRLFKRKKRKLYSVYSWTSLPALHARLVHNVCEARDKFRIVCLRTSLLVLLCWILATFRLIKNKNRVKLLLWKENKLNPLPFKRRRENETWIKENFCLYTRPWLCPRNPPISLSAHTCQQIWSLVLFKKIILYHSILLFWLKSRDALWTK